MECGQKDGICHFFFGSSEETLQKMKRVIQKRFPEAKMAEMISLPFRLFSEEENKEFIQRINEANSDIIWVSLGAPKQEIWMYENYKKLNRGIIAEVGREAKLVYEEKYTAESNYEMLIKIYQKVMANRKTL